MIEPFFIDVHCRQKNHKDERICGDVFLSKRIREENRMIAVLSDGLGHGVKANVLATLTSTMALNFTKEHKDILAIADIIMNTLPVDSERQISYATFTIVDVEYDGETHILEFDNPQSIIIRKGKIFDPGWSCILLKNKYAGKEIHTCSFRPNKEDRIIFCSDGITQSGLGSPSYPFGWGIEKVADYALDQVMDDPSLSSYKLSGKLLNRAVRNDDYHPKDDTSCTVMYFREPRKMLICTGPPYDEENDKELVRRFELFNGKKIICGATTADIISRELNREIKDSFEFNDPDLPPTSEMEGANLITEGILTLEKVHTLLRDYSPNHTLGKGPADSIVKLLLKSDEIHIIIGTRINIAHQDPSLPVDLEIRRTVVRRIARLLENDFLKEVHLEFI